MSKRAHNLRRCSARPGFEAPRNLTFLTEELRDLLNFTVADARCADPHPAPGAFHQGSNRLQVHIPAPLRNVVGVADPVTELRSAPAYFANLCHKTEISVAFRNTQYTNATPGPATWGHFKADEGRLRNAAALVQTLFLDAISPSPALPQLFPWLRTYNRRACCSRHGFAVAFLLDAAVIVWSPYSHPFACLPMTKISSFVSISLAVPGVRESRTSART